ncbi:MAG: hypothetical protein DSM106950_36840 [Stigonema ocellatum SAG 48.90 = DSM 106950]|nr:hypothetical protein [Stigonema ocellatum SAG 48.90 = DSM 106950]
MPCVVPGLLLGNVLKGGSATLFDGRQSLPEEHYKAEPCNERRCTVGYFCQCVSPSNKWGMGNREWGMGNGE